MHSLEQPFQVASDDIAQTLGRQRFLCDVLIPRWERFAAAFHDLPAVRIAASDLLSRMLALPPQPRTLYDVQIEALRQRLLAIDDLLERIRVLFPDLLDPSVSPEQYERLRPMVEAVIFDLEQLEAKVDTQLGVRFDVAETKLYPFQGDKLDTAAALVSKVFFEHALLNPTFRTVWRWADLSDEKRRKLYFYSHDETRPCCCVTFIVTLSVAARDLGVSLEVYIPVDLDDDDYYKLEVTDVFKRAHSRSVSSLKVIRKLTSAQQKLAREEATLLADITGKTLIEQNRVSTRESGIGLRLFLPNADLALRLSDVARDTASLAAQLSASAREQKTLIRQTENSAELREESNIIAKDLTLPGTDLIEKWKRGKDNARAATLFDDFLRVYMSSQKRLRNALSLSGQGRGAGTAVTTLDLRDYILVLERGSANQRAAISTDVSPLQ